MPIRSNGIANLSRVSQQLEIMGEIAAIPPARLQSHRWSARAVLRAARPDHFNRLPLKAFKKKLLTLLRNGAAPRTFAACVGRC